VFVAAQNRGGDWPWFDPDVVVYKDVRQLGGSASNVSGM
jgi:hypothetical protein